MLDYSKFEFFEYNVDYNHAVDLEGRTRWFDRRSFHEPDPPPRDWLYIMLAKGAVDLATIGRGVTAGALFLKAGRVYASETYCVECLHPCQVGEDAMRQMNNQALSQWRKRILQDPWQALHQGVVGKEGVLSWFKKDFTWE